MKTFLMLILGLAATRSNAMVMRCHTFPQPGVAVVNIQATQAPDGQLAIEWTRGPDLTLKGFFTVRFYSENGISGLGGEGSLGGAEATIQSVSEPPGTTVFSISSPNRSLDHGYGLFLNCSAQQLAAGAAECGSIISPGECNGTQGCRWQSKGYGVGCWPAN